jgi:hypothetical protein
VRMLSNELFLGFLSFRESINVTFSFPLLPSPQFCVLQPI